MPQTENNLVKTEHQSKKAQQLLSLLEPKHMREIRNPFLKSLADDVAKRKAESGGAELSSQALRNLLEALEDSTSNATATSPKAPQPEGSGGTQKLTQHDHPAVIATYLLKMPHAKRSSILRILPGGKARKVALLMRELKGAG